MDTLKFKGGPKIIHKARILLRQSVAAILNSAHYQIDYPLLQDEIVNEVNNALSSMNSMTILTLKNTFDQYNNLGSNDL